MYRSWMTKKNGCLKMKWEAMQMKSNLMKNKSPLMHNNSSPYADEPPLTFQSSSLQTKNRPYRRPVSHSLKVFKNICHWFPWLRFRHLIKVAELQHADDALAWFDA